MRKRVGLESRRRAGCTLPLMMAAFVLALPAAAGASTSTDRYIVVLENEVDRPAVVASEHGSRYEAQVGDVYRHALNGYVARVEDSEVHELRSDPQVAYVERDTTVRVAAVQADPPWGLDRIDQETLPLDESFNYANTGAGVRTYVVDTGIRFGHSEFGGRAVSGYDAVDGDRARDCHGHGTHVAGTAGGATYGVAKQTTLVGVRVLDCRGRGSASGVVAGVDWVTAKHQEEPAVANLSLSGRANSAIDRAVRRSIADGIVFTVAAGNAPELQPAQDACGLSPGRLGRAITVSATTATDQRAGWANFGSCVDWFAPGDDITSAWHASNTATATISGTSMAAPHTAGVAALYLEDHPDATPAEVRAALYTATGKHVVTGALSPNDHLLFSGGL